MTTTPLQDAQAALALFQAQATQCAANWASAQASYGVAQATYNKNSAALNNQVIAAQANVTSLGG